MQQLQEIRKYKSIKKRKKKKSKHDKIVLSKSKLSCIEFLISKTFIDTIISHDELILINNS